MNELQRAYFILGIMHGCSMEAIKTRYRRLAMVWHPDRCATDAQRQFAEEELKKINNAKDLLLKHFESGEHKASGCQCQGIDASTSAGSERSSNTYYDEEQRRQEEAWRRQEQWRREHDAWRREHDAWRKEAERKRRAAAREAEREEAARKAEREAAAREAEREEAAREAKREEAYRKCQRMDEEWQQKKSWQQFFQDPGNEPGSPQDQKLRWNIAKVEGIAFILLCLFGWIGMSARSTIHDWKWKQDAQRQEEERKNHPAISVAATNTSTPSTADTEACAQTTPSAIIPRIVAPNVKAEVRETAKLWTVGCKGINQGAIVVGQDERGQPVNALYYGPDWSYMGQQIIKYNWSAPSDQVTVELWVKPDKYKGSIIYTYDGTQEVSEIRNLDPDQNILATATMERRSQGGFDRTVVRLFESGTLRRTIYQPDKAELNRIFPMYGLFATVPKTAYQFDNNLSSPHVVTPSATIPLSETKTLSDKLKEIDQKYHPNIYSSEPPRTDMSHRSSPFSQHDSSTSTETSKKELRSLEGLHSIYDDALLDNKVDKPNR
jgi:curved DNA-binding protein CbpA